MISNDKTYVGHPIDVATGNVFTVANDFVLHGPMPLLWQRQYSSAKLDKTPLGIGWQTEFFATFKKSEFWYVFTSEEGAETVFEPPSPGKPSTNAYSRMELFEDENFFVAWAWHRKRKYFFWKLGDDRFRLVKISNHLGHSIELVYTGDRLSKLNDSVGRSVEIRYDNRGLIHSIWLSGSGKDAPALGLVQYEYDSRGRLVRSYDRHGNPRRYEYSRNHLLVKETNRLGGSFHFKYDEKNRCIHNVGDGGFQERTLVYDDEKLTTTVIDSLNRKSVYQRDPTGRIVSVENAAGGKNQKFYNPLGQTTMEIDSLGNVTAYEYDDMGDLLSVTSPVGGVQKWTYNKLHLEESMEMPTGALWQWDYTANGGIKTVTDPEGGVWEYHWGENNLIEEVVNPVGHKTEIKSDPDWRWLENGDEISFCRLEFDRFGFVEKVFDAKGLKTTYARDGNNLPVLIGFADGSVHRAIRDADGNITETRNPEGGVYRYFYDAFGNLAERVDPNGNSISWVRNSEGDIVEIVNEKKEVCAFTYDGNGNLEKVVNFDGRVEKYEYDPAGQVVAYKRPNGEITRFRWEMEQVVERMFADGSSENFEYDLIGHLIKATNDVSEVSFEYDYLGRITADVQNGHRIEFEYDKAGNLLRQQYMQGVVGPVNMRYDSRGRLLDIGDDQSIRQKFVYDELDRISLRSIGEGVLERFEYDTRRRRSRQTVTSADTVLVNREYEYDKMENVKTIRDDRRGVAHYEYDGKEQLINEVHSEKDIFSYRYDPCGNMTSDSIKNYVYDAGSRLVLAGVRRLDYDANGNVGKNSYYSETTEFIHDSANRLREIRHPDGSRTKYDYDAMGRRISKQTNESSIMFLWASDDLAAEIVDGEVENEYLMFDFEPFAVWKYGICHTPINDLSFTPQEYVGGDEQLSWLGVYDTFGRIVDEEQSGFDNPCRSAGRYFDPESGLHYNRFRYFDPATIRYIEVDPLQGEGPRLNPYWAGPNPLNWVDPLGLECGRTACGEIGVDSDGVYTDPAGRRHAGGVPARQKSIALDSGDTRSFPSRVRRAVNEIGDRHGCSTCPAMDPGTKPSQRRRLGGADAESDTGNWIVDHDPPVSQGGPPYRAKPQ